MLNLSKIRDLAREKNFTLKKIAKDLKLTENGLNRIIKLNRTKQDTLERLAKYFNVPITYFNEDYQINPTNQTINSVIISSKPKVIIQIELSENDGQKILKMVMGQDFINMLNK